MVLLHPLHGTAINYLSLLPRRFNFITLLLYVIRISLFFSAWKVKSKAIPVTDLGGL
jgi:hypothetical protein